MADYIKLIESGKAKMSAARDEVNESLHKRETFGFYSAKLEALKKIVRELNADMASYEYERLSKTENPMYAAVEKFYIDAYTVKEIRAKGTTIVERVETDLKNARIDLFAMCKECGLPLQWSVDTAKLFVVLALREADIYSMSADALARQSYLFQDLAAKKKKGETPDSNTQIVKLIQTIVDQVAFKDDGTGKNVYKCTNHDIAFLHDAITKFEPKAKCAVSLLNERQFRSVMMSLFAHCVTNEKYAVLYKNKEVTPENMSEKTNTSDATTPNKAETPATEGVAAAA